MESDDSRRIIGNTYCLSHIIGEGKFGTIWKAKHIKTKKKVAIKVIAKKKIKGTKCSSKNIKKKLIREIDIMKLCDHPHIVKYFDHYEDDNFYYIVMEYVKRGDLFEHIKEKKCLCIEAAKKIFRQLISCIEYCHGNLIVHRDIKLENILIADRDLTIKLTDFGLSNFINTNSKHKTACGSLEYCAPEIMEGDPYNPIKVDIWSMGVVLYCMVVGMMPWTCTRENMMRHICRFEYNVDKILDPVLKDLISKIFVPAEHRISLKQIKNHPWLSYDVLPSYLPPRAPLKEINLILVDKIVSLGFDKTDVLLALYENHTVQETAIYHLLIERVSGQKANERKFFGISGTNKLQRGENGRRCSSPRDNVSDKKYCKLGDVNKQHFRSLEELWKRN